MSIQVQHRRDANTVIETVTPAAGEIGFDTTKKELLIGDGATLGGMRHQKKNTREGLAPAQIAANTNDYNPTGLKHAAVLELTTDASRNLTGLVPTTAVDTTDGRQIVLYNNGSFNLVVQDQNAASAAANRFDLGGADITLSPKQSIALRYNLTSTRWQIVGGNYGQAISDGAVSARKLATSAMGMNMINGTLVPSVAGSALTIAIKTLAGADPSATDPVYVLFRDPTAATGDFVVLTLTAATSFVASSGSSLGAAANNTAFRIWLVGFNDAGTFRLGAINCLSGQDIYPLGGWGLASSTAEGGAGAADNPLTFYAGTAVTTKPYTVLGYMSWETGLAAVGTWSAGPTRAQLYGHGVSLPGTVVQAVRLQTGAVASGTTIIPFDDTAPQNTEGDQYMTKAITPSSGANLLHVRSQALLSPSVAAHLQMALFQDSAANALAASDSFQNVGSGILPCMLEFKLLANLIVQTTFKIRAGLNTAGTTTFNGFSGSRVYNSIAASFLEIAEIMA